MQDSLLFIPDISGFTRFVRTTEVEHSQHIISELLEVIIDSDELGLTVSEIEGDAVLFYLRDGVPDAAAILRQAQRTFVAFHTHLKQYETRRMCQCGACSTAHELTLKFVAHAGPIQFIRVKEAEKPHGSEVILVHRLLKNQVADREYALLTDVIMDAGPEQLPEWAMLTRSGEQYEEFGDVRYGYVTLGGLHALVPDPPPLPSFDRIENPVATEVSVRVPPDELYEIVSNLDLRLEWTDGPTELEYELDRVNRVGTRHRCVVNGDLVGFTTVTADYGENVLVYGELLDEAPLTDQLAVVYALEPEGNGTRLRVEGHYRMRGILGRVFTPLLRWKIKALLRQASSEVRRYAESLRPNALLSEATPAARLDSSGAASRG